MDAIAELAILSSHPAVAIGGPVVAVAGLSFWFLRGYVNDRKRGSSGLPPVPEIPGLPVLGNLLQLTEKKPHKIFARWAEKYGPIYSIRTGSNTMIVLNSAEVAKEAMVSRFTSISTRQLSNALKILTWDKNMVAMSDYGDFHRTVKRHVLTSTLGPNAQKRHRIHRDILIENVTKQFHTLVEKNPHEGVNFRKVFQSELFGLALKQAVGKDVESIYVEELATMLSREEVFKILVIEPLMGAIEVDWRDFFPYLKWIPNRGFEKKIQQMHFNRVAVMRALIKEQKKRIDSGEEINCYLDYLLSEGKTLSDTQILMLVWEAIIESSDTTMVSTEWALFELAKDPELQERLYQEIQAACRSEVITEEKLSQIPYLSSVFQETLRRHSPAPIVPLRYAHEDTQLGGYFIPAGSQIAINIYGCNMDKNEWDNPEEWRPERFLNDNSDVNDLYKTMAFGAGKRVCAGSLQAMLISCITIGKLIQEFEWRLKEGEEDDANTLGLTTQKLKPMEAILKPRK